MRLPFLNERTTVGDPMRGVTVHHLCTDFLDRISEAGIDPQTCKVHEIEEKVIRGLSKDTTCPRDSRPGSAYVDTLSEENAGIATYMISYSWGYTVRDICDTLHSFCKQEKADPKRTFIWICCLCVNQHRVREARDSGTVVPFETFEKEFRNRVLSVQKGVIAMMAPWSEPLYLTRVWCVFEMFTAVSQNKFICITMPPRESVSFSNAFSSTGGEDSLNKMWKSLGNIDVSNAAASVEEDKINIEKAIESSIGAERVNETVAAFMRKWMVSTAKQEVDRVCKDTNVPGKEKLLIISRTGDLLRKTRKFEDARAVLKKGQSLNFNKTKEYAVVLMTLGSVDRNQGKLDDAMHWYKQSKEIHRNIGTIESLDYAALLRNIATIYEEKGNFSNAMKTYKEALQVHVDTDTQTTTDCASTYRDMGSACRKAGNLKGAVINLNQAMKIREALDIIETPDGALVLLDYGRCHASLFDKNGEQHDLIEAIKCIERGINIRRKIGTWTQDDENNEKELTRLRKFQASNLLASCAQNSCICS